MSRRVEEHIRPDGSSPYGTWFGGLDCIAAAKVSVAIVRLGMGNTSSVKWFDGIGEYVIDWGPGYRVYLAKDGNDLIILYGGGTKRHQQADINKAKVLHEEYKSRKAELSRRATAPKRKKKR